MSRYLLNSIRALRQSVQALHKMHVLHTIAMNGAQLRQCPAATARLGASQICLETCHMAH